MSPMMIGLIVLTLAVGFAIGFGTFRRSTCWCATCGATLRCTQCIHRRTVAR
jgi:hypothetical protein